MTAFAIYRLPYDTVFHLVIQDEGKPEEFASVHELNGREGFVIAPFCTNRQNPVLLLHADRQMEIPVQQLDCQTGEYMELFDMLGESCHDLPKGLKIYNGKEMHYAIDFANFHSHILDGEFTKIVLARCSREKPQTKQSPLTLMRKACLSYPRMFVALVSAERCGTWLMATPELLLEGDGTKWKTVSLAGTMALNEEQMDFDNPPQADVASMRHRDDGSIVWNIKNIQEQRFVSTYITECLEHFTNDIEEYGPYTMRAGNLVHLRSDFHFTLPKSDRLGQLLSRLYPTPAVCGLPKEAARDFILRNEYARRDYYSGFVGPLSPAADTHLYVSLRCMRIDSQGYSLYAGGGLLSDSDMKTEWKETEDKMQTMRSLFEEENV